jgi:hypothetical protein
MRRPDPSVDRQQAMRLLDTRLAIVLASEPGNVRLRAQVDALRARLSVTRPDRRTLAEVAEVVDQLSPRRTIDGARMPHPRPATPARGVRRWPRTAGPYAAGLAGLLVLLV